MKKYIFTSLLASIVAFSSCSDFLDIRPENSVPVEGLDYSNPDNLFEPISAAYASMRNNDAHAFPYFGMFEVASDNADKGSSPSDNPPMGEIDAINFQPGNYIFNNIWVAFFNVVSVSNYAIEAMDTFYDQLPQETDKATAIQYQGEAKTIRAYAYFQLTRLFGNVPKIDKNYTADELGKLPQTGTAQLYEFILKDLDEAIEVLPESYTNLYPGRITKYTAAAIKAKVCLYNEQYDEAAKMCDMVIASGKFNLLPVFSTYFSLAGKNSVESIFEIQSSTLGNTFGEATYIEYAYQQGPRNNTDPKVQGWGFCVPSDDLISFFKDRNDSIRAATTLLYRGTKTPEGDSISTQCENPVYNGKVYTPSYDNTWSYNGYGFDQNVRVLRYADILLIYAEALKRGASTGSASGMSGSDAFNLVRKRAGLGTIDDPTLEQIWDERRAELAMEEDRYFDLVRTGQAQSVFAKLGLTYNPNKNNIYPIPLNQLDLNSNLKQNPNY